ncbi:hypothetical protein F3Y22_tig00110745pilonHSYRG00236 [Hibiscus syriacus]|uniref:USP domain-containing protein n=1 Tax=Hibiscus syriacus TaxID=106335 RepID=A0A6A2ZUH3_HIBSY|nr:hypothetical protein F3Y22_tig00110745pilonHSYRG00236 [Hibiscus syriacus]
MGPRKKNVSSPRVKQAAELRANNTKIEASAPPSEPDDGSSYAAVQLECGRALTVLRRGNHTKALRLMKDLCARHENSAHAALIYVVQSTVFKKAASVIDDRNAKQRHFKNAIDSAKKAAELFPNSIQCAHCYANLLYEYARDVKELQEVIQECERALAIENPVDPTKENFQEESPQEIRTAEARILHVQNELRELIERSNISSICAWIKNIGSGEECFRFFPIKKVTDDPMEFRRQILRLNEINKDTKTPEERRKEIEARVAAARFLQQKSDAAYSSPLLQRAGSSVGGQRGGAGIRRKNGSTSERRDWVRSFWNSMSLDSKKDLLRISIRDLKTYFGLLKHGLAGEVFAEALAFAEVNKTWMFWVCCRCGEKFVDSQSHMQHVAQKHMGNLIPEMVPVLPRSVDNEWINMLLNCSWDPLDISAAVKIIGKRSKFDDSEVKIVARQLVDGWTTVDDVERSKLLERIGATFELLIRHNYLAASHLNKVIQFTMDALQNMVSGSQLLDYGVHQSPFCICFLGATQLRKIFKFLHDISHFCGLDRYSEKDAPVDDVNDATQVLEVKEKIVLSADASCLLLDEHSLPDAAIEDASQDDAILSWIFAGPSSGVHLARWIRMKEEKRKQGIEILQKLEKEFGHLQSLCERKCDHIIYEEALQAVEDLCLEEEAEAQLCDLESGEDDDWEAKDYLHKVDTCIEVALQRQKEQVSMELSKVDARIMRNITTGKKQLEVKFKPVSAHDYRTILLPLVKSYLRVHMEDLAKKDATEKSDAAREAFLAELARDSNNGIRGGNDNSRNSLEKSKDKKKNKEFRKSKDSRASGGNELHILNDETAEQVPLEFVSDGDHLGSEVVSLNGDELNSKQQEEDIRVEGGTSEWQTVRKGRRHKSSNRYLDGKYQVVLREEETIQFGSFRFHVEEQVRFVDGVPADGGKVFSVLFVVECYALVLCFAPIFGVGDKKTLRQLQAREDDEDRFQADLEKDALQSLVAPISGEGDTMTLRQLQAREDDEERFKADLEKDALQSLVSDTYQAQRAPLQLNDCGVSPNDLSNEGLNETDAFGTGLQNEVGEYNCFLNVIIQSLWHLRRFRDEFLRRSTSDHVHVGDPCVVCAVYEIFIALNIASTDAQKESVAPTLLRIALSNLYPDGNFFQEAQMNDASEVLAVIFDCLHQSFTSGSSVCDSDSADSNCTRSWDCANSACIVHSLFGMDVFERMNCSSCGLESRHLKYTTFFHNINASSLRTMKVMRAESSFDDLLNLVEMNHQLTCDPEAGGCGKLNYFHHLISNSPQVFTTVLGWQKTCESAGDIAATLAALNSEIDVSVIYHGLDPKNKHNLVSMVCYYRQHYHCFAYSHDRERWIMYDDEIVKVIGSWGDVATTCEQGRFQPQVLFFEAAD